MLIATVPDMSCGHCRAAIEAKLAPLTSQLHVDLDAKTIRAAGINVQALQSALEEIGFTPSELRAES